MSRSKRYVNYIVLLILLLVLMSPLWFLRHSVASRTHTVKATTGVPIDSCASHFPLITTEKPTGWNARSPPRTTGVADNQRLLRYVEALGNVDLKEYTTHRNWYIHNVIFVFMVDALTRYQHTLGITGAVGEIGVHFGGFFLSIAASALSEEQLLVVDIFDNQQYNTDGSGKGNLEVFKRNCELVGIDPEVELNIIKSPSTLVTTEELAMAANGVIRFFSIDGGHTREATCHDMNLVDSLLHEGGIMVVDDVGCCTTKGNTWSLGVIDGIHAYFAVKRDMEPFFFYPPKMFFAKSKYAQIYRSYLIGNFNDIFSFTEAQKDFGVDMHPSRYTLFGGRVLQVGKDVSESWLVQKWRDMM